MPNARQEIIKKAKDQPLLSQTAMKLMELMRDEDHEHSDVTRVVENDSVLTAEVLKAVNSAAYGLREKVTSVSQAIAYLGENIIVGIAFNTLNSSFFQKPLNGYESPQGELWKHSLKTAIAARILSKQAKQHVSSELAFTAGILHDIGKSILSDFLRGTPHDLIEYIEKGEIKSYVQAEEQAVGISHDELGYELSLHWNIPEPLPTVIRYHHRPAEAPESLQPLVYIIHLADMVAMMTGSATGSDAMLYPIDNKYPDFFILNPKSLEDLVMNVLSEFEKTEKMLFGQQKENG